ncbi:MAG: trimethylamine methyltransferase family protein, partial [Planctomycetota bacterium]
FPTSFKSELLSQAELETLKGGTLRLLDEVGVHFPSRKALEIFADHGAKVDMDTEIVRIPPDLVQKAMSTAPRSFVLGGRETGLLIGQRQIPGLYDHTWNPINPAVPLAPRQPRGGDFAAPPGEVLTPLGAALDTFRSILPGCQAKGFATS